MAGSREEATPLRRSRRAPSVEGLEPRRLLSAADLVGATAARDAYHVDGSGLAVAVIDTGVNYQHEALGGAIGPGHKVAAGFDFADNTSDPSPAPGPQHGTAVAGLIASADPANLGVAPGAGIIPLRVFDQNGQGSFAAIASALQWVINNHSQYHISVVNLSISDGSNASRDGNGQGGGVGPQIEGLIHQLDQMNIPVVTAAGNSYAGSQGMGFPAIDGETISVAALGTNGQLASDAQRLGAAQGGASATKLVAPGTNLIAPVQNNDFAPVTGSSFSAALVSGAIVLLQQIYEARFGSLPSVAALESWLQQGSDPVADAGSGSTFDGLDIPKAAALVPSPAPPPAPAPTPAPTPTPTPTAPVATPATVLPVPAAVVPAAPPTARQARAIRHAARVLALQERRAAIRIKIAHAGAVNRSRAASGG